MRKFYFTIKIKNNSYLNGMENQIVVVDSDFFTLNEWQLLGPF